MKFKKALSFLLCIIMAVTVTVTTISATNEETNVSMTVSSEEVTVGDTLTVVVTYKDMSIAAFACKLQFDTNLLECTKVVGGRSGSRYESKGWLYDGTDYWPALTMSTYEEANTAGQVGFAFVDTEEYEYVSGVVYTVTFIAKAAGTVEFTLIEDSSGSDGFKDTAETKTLTILDATPSCTHETTKAVSNGDGTHDIVCASEACGETVTKGVTCADENKDHKCDACEYVMSECADGNNDHNCDVCGEELSQCADNNNDHDCDVCGEELSQCADNNNDHDCDVCGEELSECADNNNDHNCDVCGKEGISEHAYDYRCATVCNICLKETRPDADEHSRGGNPACGDRECVYGCGTLVKGTGEHLVDRACEGGLCLHGCGTVVPGTGVHTYENYYCACGAKFTGWDGQSYVVDGVKLSGWNEVADAWYYFGNDGYVTGLVRVPYPAEAINGVTYAPNAADKDYWETHQDTSKYSDAENAVFVFAADGKFVQESGIVDGNKYAADGCVAWHVGFVKVGSDYYYFVGDKVNGGNVMATGKVYATRDYNSGKSVAGTTIYFFGNDGKLLQNVGVAQINDVLYYFNSESMLARGNGLTEVDGGYVYVRSNGQLAIGTYYANGVKYEFDENGFTKGAKNGIVDGGFYENGHRKFGLIEYNGDIYYFRTTGGFATGEYYISNTNGIEGFEKGDRLVFGEDGKLLDVKNGIVEEGGKLYYYEKNHRVYGAGVVEMTDDQGETYYIYVRSNGQLATGKYWPTTRNGLLESGEYDWGSDGKYYPGK